MATQTQSIPVINSASELNQHQFENRYSIYCHDPFEYQPVSNELVEQLAKDLKAEGAVIVDITVSSGRQGRYLTADSFDTIQYLINEKENDKDYLAEGYGAYLLDISSPLFYKGYPKLFWKDYQFDDRVSSQDEWGEVIYQHPLRELDPMLESNNFVIPEGEDEFGEKIYDCGDDYLVEINNFPGWSYS